MSTMIGMRALRLPGLLVACTTAVAAQAPDAVAPGSITDRVTTSPCPTFSWGAFERAMGYELVVYQVGGPDGRQDEDAAPVLAERIEGAATAWSPSLEHCLENGERYAWSVRAITRHGPSDWAVPLTFETSQPSACTVPGRVAELEAQLRDLRHRLELISEGVEDSNVAPFSRTGRLEKRWSRGLDAPGGKAARLRPSPGQRGAPELETGGSSVPAAAPFIGNPSAKIKVVGEVRTVDSGGEPRLWRRGRPGIVLYATEGGQSCSDGVFFGLTDIPVTWGAAADACPAGTWVCRASEVAACDTARPDLPFDGYDCNGNVIDFPADDHAGWLADRSAVVNLYGEASSEKGDLTEGKTCLVLPVWCCF